jgi:hypothetical protein
LDEEDIRLFVLGRLPRAKLGAKLYKSGGELMALVKGETNSPKLPFTTETKLSTIGSG